MSLLRCSHVLCKVDDIGAAVRDFTELGFTVTWGGAPERAHNALIWFAQGPFIELFELPRAFAGLRVPFTAAYGRSAGSRLAHWAGRGEGWRDLALETDDTDLAATRARLRAAGLHASKVVRRSRVRPDGQRVRYQFLAAGPAALPFVVSAYDPPQRPAEVVHPNGAEGVETIRYGLPDRQRALLDTLLDDQRRLVVEPAPVAGVLGVELRGLAAALDPDRSHGAVVVPSTRTERRSRG